MHLRCRREGISPFAHRVLRGSSPIRCLSFLPASPILTAVWLTGASPAWQRSWLEDNRSQESTLA